MSSRLRLAAALAVALAVTFATVGRAGAAIVGPRLAVNVAHIYPNAGTEVRTMGPTGEGQTRLAGGADLSAPAPIYDTAPAWAPDGKEVAFFGPDGEGPVTYLVGEDGTHLRELKSMIAPAGPRTFVQEPPVFDPHGNLVGSVFKLLRGHFDRPAGFDEEGPPVVAVALWSFPTAGGKPHPLGPFKTDRIVVPFSFAPDGTLLAEEVTRAGPKLGTLDPQGGAIHPVIADPQGLEEPAFSPDGSRIAYLHDKLGRPNRDEETKVLASSLMVVPAAGGTPRLVAKVKGGARWPAWDPSGTRLSFTTLEGGSYAGVLQPRQGNALIEVNADGTCLTKVLGTKRGTIFGSSWQPGADRGAGPIAC